MGHGSGGRLMHSLIKELLFKKLANPVLGQLSDAAVIRYKEGVAFTTDSFVVNPLDFPGGDIGKLAVCGTVNDLLMQGARPEYLSLALIIEEGFDYRHLEKIIDSVAFWAKRANVLIAAGDLKVVEAGAADKIFINTSGIGRLVRGRNLSVKNIRVKDKIIITGSIAEHGFAVLSSRRSLNLGFEIKSDCSSLNNLLLPLIKSFNQIKFMRDPTRGGLATTLNEAAESSGLAMMIDESAIPVSGKVRAAAELLGIDPLYVASEGRAVIVIAPEAAEKAIAMLRKHPLGRGACLIGEVAKSPKARVVLKTAVGTERIVDMLIAEPLPRIC